MKKRLITLFIFISFTAVISGCIPSSRTRLISTIAPQGTKNSNISTRPVIYENKTYGFSFKIPAGWAKQSGHPDSRAAQFNKRPYQKSCSFQFHINPMQKSFSAKTYVNASLKKATRSGKYLSVKRRNDIGTIGWEVVEKGKATQLQKIIYQVYDAQNRYFKFTASADTEKFTDCRQELRTVVNSIRFS